MIAIRYLAALASVCFTAGAFSASTSLPEPLAALVKKAQIGDPIVRWCGIMAESGSVAAYAIAALSADRGGRYLALSTDGKTSELAPFVGRADLSCYTPAEARELNNAIAAAGTVHGEIAPTWSTTVICGFVEETNAVCWQYSPKDRAFLKVGEWTT